MESKVTEREFTVVVGKDKSSFQYEYFTAFELANVSCALFEFWFKEWLMGALLGPEYRSPFQLFLDGRENPPKMYSTSYALELRDGANDELKAHLSYSISLIAPAYVFVDQKWNNISQVDVYEPFSKGGIAEWIAFHWDIRELPTAHPRKSDRIVTVEQKLKPVRRMAGRRPLEATQWLVEQIAAGNTDIKELEDGWSALRQREFNSNFSLLADQKDSFKKALRNAKKMVLQQGRNTGGRE